MAASFARPSQLLYNLGVGSSQAVSSRPPQVARPCRAHRAARLVSHSGRQGSGSGSDEDDGWMSWADLPDSPPAANGTAAAAAAAADLDWRSEVQGLAQSLRSGQVASCTVLAAPQCTACFPAAAALSPLLPLPPPGHMNSPLPSAAPRHAQPLPCPSLQSSDGDSAASDREPQWEEEERERCFLVGVQLKQQRSRHGYSVRASLEELGRLADTAGLEVMGSTYQLLDEVGRVAV